MEEMTQRPETRTPSRKPPIRKENPKHRNLEPQALAHPPESPDALAEGIELDSHLGRVELRVCMGLREELRV